MTNKIKLLIGIGATALLLSSCSVTAPGAVSANPVGKKIGTSKAKYFFGLCFGGDYGIQTAAKNGGISKVSTVDVKYYTFLIYHSRTTIVTGE